MQSPSRYSPRLPLSDLTNDVFQSEGSPRRGKRRAEDLEGTSKRSKFSNAEPLCEVLDAKNEIIFSSKSLDLACVPQRRQRQGVYGALHALRSGDPAARRSFTRMIIHLLYALKMELTTTGSTNDKNSADVCVLE